MEKIELRENGTLVFKIRDHEFDKEKMYLETRDLSMCFDKKQLDKLISGLSIFKNKNNSVVVEQYAEASC